MMKSRMGKRLSQRIFSLTLAVLLLAGCASAPPETRAGEWQASTDFGEFTLIVDPSGTAITEIDYSYQSCSKAIISGSATFTSTLTGKDGAPIASIENGKFSIEITGLGTISFEGKFSKDGTRASGNWVAGDCSGKWTSNR